MAGDRDDDSTSPSGILDEMFPDGVDPENLVWVGLCAQGRAPLRDVRARPSRTRGRSARDSGRYREHLRLAGIDRAKLFEKTDVRLPVRAHDMRATFITVALANGKSEGWIQDRTGHRSSIMINRYRRVARTVAESMLGDLAPMDGAMEELAQARGIGPESVPDPSDAEPELTHTPDIIHQAGLAELVDAGDLKSLAGDSVRVRVPRPASRGAPSFFDAREIAAGLRASEARGGSP